MDQISQATTESRWPYHGPISSDSFNELVRSLVLDLASLINAFNQYLQPLVDSLPGGDRQITEADRTSLVDPVANGLDGSQLYTDLTSSSRNPLLYNEALGRPATLLESLSYLQQQFLDEVTLLNQTYVPASGLTNTPKSTEPEPKSIGTVALADRVNWDPKALGSGGPYLVWWNGSAWRYLNEQ